MLLNNRIIFSDNGVLSDSSIDLSTITSGTKTLPVVAAQDYLYLGSDLPFNHRYFEVSTANDQSSVVSVEIWDGNSWVACVDVLDQTSSGGKTLAQSGIISWVKEKNATWGKEESSENVTGISSLKIYDMYWARLVFGSDLKATTALQYVGHKFATDDDLIRIYPDLGESRAMTTYKAGKTNWNEQHIVAAEDIVARLRKDRKIKSENQIFQWELFNMAAVRRCAQIIFNAFGTDYDDNAATAEKEFYKAYNGIYYGFDKDEDGRLDSDEKLNTSGLYRT